MIHVSAEVAVCLLFNDLLVLIRDVSHWCVCVFSYVMCCYHLKVCAHWCVDVLVHVSVEVAVDCCFVIVVRVLFVMSLIAVCSPMSLFWSIRV